MPDGGTVKKGETFVQWDPYNVPILTEKAGKVEFRDMIEGVTDEEGSRRSHRRQGHGRHRAQGRSASADRHRGRRRRKSSPATPIPAGAHVVVEEGEKIAAGTLLAKTPRKSRQDQGHHRRSAARGRTLRSAPSEGRRRDRQDRRHRRDRRHRPRQAQASSSRTPRPAPRKSISCR